MPDNNSLVGEKIAQVEARLNGRIARIETRLDSMEPRMARIEQEVSTLRYWLLGAVMSAVLTIAAIVMGFASYQATWFQTALQKNWDQTQKALDKIDSTMLKVERMDAQKQPVTGL